MTPRLNVNLPSKEDREALEQVRLAIEKIEKKRLSLAETVRFIIHFTHNEYCK